MIPVLDATGGYAEATGMVLNLSEDSGEFQDAVDGFVTERWVTLDDFWAIAARVHAVRPRIGDRVMGLLRAVSVRTGRAVPDANLVCEGDRVCLDECVEAILRDDVPALRRRIGNLPRTITSAIVGSIGGGMSDVAGAFGAVACFHHLVRHMQVGMRPFDSPCLGVSIWTVQTLASVFPAWRKDLLSLAGAAIKWYRIEVPEWLVRWAGRKELEWLAPVAIAARNALAVIALAELGVDWTSVPEAASWERLSAMGLDRVVRNRSRETALHFAAIGVVVASMTRDGAGVSAVDYDLRTPLDQAADAEAARLLVRAGANANARDHRGCTPVRTAANRGDGSVIASSFGAGAGVAVRDDYEATPLHFAHGEAVAALLAAGADPNARDRSGDTPLHNAAVCGKDAAARVLLEAGADPCALNGALLTPIEVALRHGNVALAAILSKRERE
jgi:hypothetical protein